MRKRVLFFTSVIVLTALVLSPHIEVHAAPTRESARVQTAVLPVRIDTSSKRLQTQTPAYPARFRNIFAPLEQVAPSVPVLIASLPRAEVAFPVSRSTPLPSAVVSTTLATPTAPITPSAPLRLSAMIDDIVYQEVEAQFTTQEKEYYDSLLAGAFAKFPTEYVQQLKRLTLKKSRTGSRGLGGASVMILRTAGVPENDFVAVAIHELGHIVDMGAVAGDPAFGASSFMDGAVPVWNNDSSLKFYTISWDTDLVRRTASAEDFVSGYAMTDPFEDFAESFAMYVLHGERFARLAQENTALARKYGYIRDSIFKGREFRGVSAIPATTSLTERPWDVTVQPYSKAAFDLLAAW